MWIFFNIQSDFKTQIQKVSDQIKDIYLPSTLKIDSTSQHFPHQHFFFYNLVLRTLLVGQLDFDCITHYALT